MSFATPVNRLWRRAFCVVAGAGVVVTPSLDAQSDVRGVVRGWQDRTPLAHAEAVVSGLGVRAFSDSLGKFRLKDIPPGNYQLVVRAPGFASDTSELTVGVNESIALDFVLRPAVAVLNEVRIAGEAGFVSPKLVGFAERRRAGSGRFLDSVAIAPWHNRRTSDMLALVAGIDVRRSLGNKAWVVGGRAVSPHKCAFCNERKEDVLDVADINAGAGIACYADVYLDGVLVYNSSTRKVPLFDVNSIPPSNIIGIEFYAGGASVPAKYNATSGGCGVLLIWTR
jgi:hypothetical protein